MGVKTDRATMELLKAYVEEHPITGEKISRSKLMRIMFGIIENVHYGRSFSKEERLRACDLLKNIINDEGS